MVDVPGLIGLAATRLSPSVSRRDAAAIILAREGERCQLAFRRPVILSVQRIGRVSPVT